PQGGPGNSDPVAGTGPAEPSPPPPGPRSRQAGPRSPPSLCLLPPAGSPPRPPPARPPALGPPPGPSVPYPAGGARAEDGAEETSRSSGLPPFV
ncbi:hypothetical protein P7K49_032829, partial [Saguinus oedipus]